MTLAFDLGFKSEAQYKKYKKKFHELPYLTGVVFEEGTQNHLESIRDVLETGMRKNNLGMSKLSPMTMRIREAKGQSSKPTSPLVGDGGLIRNLEIVKVGNGYNLQPNNKFSVTKNPDGKTTRISWKKLWMIQEWGMIITVTQKLRYYFLLVLKIPLKQSTTQMVIAARRPFQRAYNRYLRSEIRKENNEAMKKRLKALIRPTS
ncbi:hypothetical protein [Leptospira andrefontaineae]|uniref:Uncharacterized protein n=1 Tax=Leptospira andrefontaineae TaxID=2484976 RepID=A0A4R9GXK3_9LEPT|nr:hypothetical protein [Leptospira andrefontaineae]TGK36286.1 hypothetical protein EHO65_18470 [Leptospira andrefontaineae]